MVSKKTNSIKRTPPRSVKNRRSKSPSKKKAIASAATVLASINKSILTCHKRLIKLFSKLARIATPNPNRSSNGYKILKKSDHRRDSSAAVSAVRRSLAFDEENDKKLLPPIPGEKRTVFLDLDETLVHSQSGPIPPERFDFVVKPKIDGETMSFYVLKRPGVDEFLAALASEGFEVVVFTAGLREYASLVVDRLDRGRGVVAHRLYRDACSSLADGRLVKDLSAAGRDLRRAVIVDDNPNSYSLQPENAVPVSPFVDDLGDRELVRVLGVLKGFDGVEDVREGLKVYLESLDHNDINVAVDDDDSTTTTL